MAGLAAGKYTVDATYNGNYKYNINDTLSKTFEVRKVVASLTIDDSFTDALTPAEIFVHINKTATGTITITVKDKPYTQPITDGVATFTIDVLPAGDYDISAVYNPERIRTIVEDLILILKDYMSLKLLIIILQLLV